MLRHAISSYGAGYFGWMDPCLPIIVQSAYYWLVFIVTRISVIKSPVFQFKGNYAACSNVCSGVYERKHHRSSVIVLSSQHTVSHDILHNLVIFVMSSLSSQMDDTIGVMVICVHTRIRRYSLFQEICTRFCCALLWCGYAIVHNEFTWSIYPYSSGLLCWHWGNR